MFDSANSRISPRRPDIPQSHHQKTGSTVTANLIKNEDPDMVDWEGRGYFAFLDAAAPTNALQSASSAIEPFVCWRSALASASAGDFSRLPGLVDLSTQNISPVVARLCSELLGDAGPASCIVDVAARLATGSDRFEESLRWCRVLAQRGNLADVPLVLDTLSRFADVRDADIISALISDWLEEGEELFDYTDFESMEHYREAVLSRHSTLIDKFGTDQVSLVNGERRNVVWLGQRILRRLREPYFPYALRRTFECMTGIDCSSFYQNGRIKPMQAAALLEGFLESSQSRQFDDGVPYFFGHRIP